MVLPWGNNNKRSSITKSNNNSNNASSIFSIKAMAIMLSGCLLMILWIQSQNISSRMSSSSSSMVSSSSSISSSSSCPMKGSSELNHPIVFSKSAVQSQSIDRLEILKEFTTEEYAKYMTAPAGTEHYRLLTYLVNQAANNDDCRHVVDIGTRYVGSALALASAYRPVWTFDIPSSKEREQAFRGKTEAEWQMKLKQTTTGRGRRGTSTDIIFHNVDLLQVPVDEFRRYMSTTWLILLDTFHLPYTVPFEREFMTRLLQETKFKGIMLLDDIHLNDEMEKWWKELQENAKQNGYVCHDITFLGHFSGTGLLDFTQGKRVTVDTTTTN